MAGLRRASTNRVGAELRFVQRRVGLLRFRTAWVAGEGAGTAGKGAGTASAGRQDDDDDDDLLLGTTAALRGPKLLLDRVTDCLLDTQTLY